MAVFCVIFVKYSGVMFSQIASICVCLHKTSVASLLGTWKVAFKKRPLKLTGLSAFEDVHAEAQYRTDSRVLILRRVRLDRSHLLVKINVVKAIYCFLLNKAINGVSY